jgi:hypothetical protein
MVRNVEISLPQNKNRPGFFGGRWSFENEL